MLNGSWVQIWVSSAKPARRLSAHVPSSHDNERSVPVLVPSEMGAHILYVLSEIGSSLYVSQSELE